MGNLGSDLNNHRNLKFNYKQYVLSSTRDFWLLSNALAATLAILVELGVHIDKFNNMNPLLQHDDFHTKLEILRGNMSLEVMFVMRFFLSFTQTFISKKKTHNIIVLMVDPRFRGMECVIEKARAIVREYDEKVLIPYLVKV